MWGVYSFGFKRGPMMKAGLSIGGIHGDFFYLKADFL